MAETNTVPWTFIILLMFVTAWWFLPYTAKDWNMGSEEIVENLENYREFTGQKGKVRVWQSVEFVEEVVAHQENGLIIIENFSSVRQEKDGDTVVERVHQLERINNERSHQTEEGGKQRAALGQTQYSSYGMSPAMKLALQQQTINWRMIPCDICKVVVDLVQTLFKQHKSTQFIKQEVAKFCISMKLYDARVCNGTVNLFSSEVLTVADRVALSSHEICGILFGDSCADPYNPFLMWNITLPSNPKPPVKPPTPPQPGSPKLRILQLSDIHMDFDYKPGSNAECSEPLCCRSDDGPIKGEPAGKWGDYRNCDIPTWTLENLFQHLEQNETFDFIYWTGDLPGHNIWNQTREDQLRALEFVSNLFKKYLPNTPMYPTLGNHESSPVDSFPPPYIKGDNSIEWLYDSLISNWSSWLPKDTYSTIAKGAYYSVVLKPGFRLISLNMNYCNHQNWWMLINMTDPAGELAWLVDQLQYAENNHEKVHIIGHIPPGSSACVTAWSWNYYTIINRYESTVAAQFFGHAHTDYYEVFYDPETNFTRPVSTAYVAPSVTTYSYLNPGFRIYETDGFYGNSSWDVLDFETYIMNLTEANLSNQPKWRLEYKAKSAYDLDNLYPADWDKLIYRMWDDEQLFMKFYRYYNKEYPADTCDASCKSAILCYLRSGRSNDANLCRDIPSGYDNMKTHGYLNSNC